LESSWRALSDGTISFAIQPFLWEKMHFLNFSQKTWSLESEKLISGVLYLFFLSFQVEEGKRDSGTCDHLESEKDGMIMRDVATNTIQASEVGICDLSQGRIQDQGKEGAGRFTLKFTVNFKDFKI
jgi:hypothetical protein